MSSQDSTLSTEQVKDKIVKTIATYEARCKLLNSDVSALRQAMTSLCQIPLGMNDEMDSALFSLKEYLREGAQVDTVQQQIKSLNKMVLNTRPNQSAKQESSQDVIPRLAVCLENLDLSKKEVRQYDNFKELLKKEKDGAIVVESFNQLLKDVLGHLAEQVKVHKENSNGRGVFGKSKQEDLLDPGINQSLKELLDHIALSEALEPKARQISTDLDNNLFASQLSGLIEELTELVVGAFDTEQTKLETFIQRFSSHLNGMDSYLSNTKEGGQQALSETTALEEGIQNNIQQIQKQIIDANSIEALADSVAENLMAINQGVKVFKEHAQERMEESEKQACQLKEELIKAEVVTEELKNSITYHKNRASRDRLTDLANREAYDERVQEAYQRWLRDKGDLVLAVGDIDFFKTINDNLGHLAGDKVLKNVATLMKSSIRAVDFLARYGGEEFVFIFENTKKEDAETLLNTIRLAIEECQFHCKERRIVVTMSFGLADFLPNDEPEEVFQRADSALYEAKKTGRNRVISS